MKNFQVISLIPTWHDASHNPNVVQVEATDALSALRERLDKLGTVGFDNFYGTFLVLDEGGRDARAVYFSVSSSQRNHVINRIEFGS